MTFLPGLIRSVVASLYFTVCAAAAGYFMASVGLVNAAPLSFVGQVAGAGNRLISTGKKQLVVFGEEAAIPLIMRKPKPDDAVLQIRVTDEKKTPLEFDLRAANEAAETGAGKSLLLVVPVAGPGAETVTVCARYKARNEKRSAAAPTCVPISIVKMN